MKYGLYVDFIKNNIPIYVGIGTLQRIKKPSRNNKHTNISNKYKITRKVIFHTNDYHWLQIQEILAIRYYNTLYKRSKYGCNLTPGGEGLSNVCLEVRNKISKSHLGKKLKDSTKLKLSLYFTGKTHTIDTMNKVAISMGGKPFNVYKRILCSGTLGSKTAEYKKGRYIGKWVNQMQCCRDLKPVTRKGISRCLSGQQKQHKGFIFEYSEKVA